MKSKSPSHFPNLLLQAFYDWSLMIVIDTLLQLLLRRFLVRAGGFYFYWTTMHNNAADNQTIGKERAPKALKKVVFKNY